MDGSECRLNLKFLFLSSDRTLKQYDTLIQPFMKALPSVNWKFLIEKEPEFTDLKPMLANSDVYV